VGEKLQVNEDQVFMHLQAKVTASTESFVTAMFGAVKGRVASESDDDFFVIIFTHGDALQFQFAKGEESYKEASGRIEYEEQQVAMTIHASAILKILEEESAEDAVWMVAETILWHFRLLPVPNYDFDMVYIFRLN